MTDQEDYEFEFDFGFASIQTMLYEAAGIKPDIGALASTLSELGVDSLDSVGLAMDLEDRYRIDFIDCEVAELGDMTVGNLVDLVLEKQGIKVYPLLTGSY